MKKQNDKTNTMALMSALNIGWNIVVSVLLGAYCGYWLDEKLDFAPLFMIGGIIMGMVSGLYAAVSSFKSADQPKKDTKNDVSR